MDNQTQRKALRQAAALINSVVHQLDTTAETCAECGALRRRRWVEYRAYVALSGLPQKLRVCAEKLDDATPEASAQASMTCHP